MHTKSKPSISEWTLRTESNQSHSTDSKYYYERLLGPNELGFYWDSACQGTADTLQHAIVEETSQSQLHLEIQSEENVRAAWMILKTRYPLLGAKIEERPTLPAVATSLSSQNLPKEDLFFVVDPVRLYAIGSPHAHPQEVVFLSCTSEEKVLSLAEGIMNGFGWRDVQDWQEGNPRVHDDSSPSRLLSNNLPACILFIRRIDYPSRFHVMIQAAHLITDGIGNSTILSEFLDLLSGGKTRNSLIDAPLDKIMLEERLKLSISSEALYPDDRLDYSRAKRRWHRVLGKILLALRSAKISGGHSLPRIIRPSTAYTSAKSAFITYAFDLAQTIKILRRCKELGITFGNAHPVLGQLAVTRVLLRRRLRTLSKKRRGIPLTPSEDIDDEEWFYRRRQPMMTGGPANLRPYLDQDWYTKGGARNVCLSISFFFLVLPFMPLGEAGTLSDGAIQVFSSDEYEVPPFGKLLSKKRFLLRCRSVRKQSSEVFRHSRFLDVHAARIPMRIDRSRTTALMYRKDIARPEFGDDAMIPVLEQPEAMGGAVMGHGGSSFGKSDHLVPPYYPCNTASKSSTTLHLVRSTTHLRCRPTELYFGASTAQGQLSFNMFWDENVYKREVVMEWLDEVRAATVWFLGVGEAEDGSTQLEKGGGITSPVVVMANL
ncbi:hypothetical protein F5890DRAFT_1612321 [Lentinula detonsa]|uniref:Uncharacterized protein n=1 Tax=Lentinula detonsa TaxID=2804962 RepID=A0AA38QAM8_9AGAR|nr:hypothetical protein F5890DRAFT_1612321 [Lentinula detonsa]